MKKRTLSILSLILGCLLLFAGCGGTVQEPIEPGETGTTEGLEYYSLPDGTFAVSAGTTLYLSEIIIPETYKGKAVSTILPEAFQNATNLTSITIPDSVTSIGDSAFNGCTGLTSITIPNSVTSIGNSSFSGCTSLTSITIPNSVTSIGDSAFYRCTNLTSITIPNSVTSIGKGAFADCSSLESITLPFVGATKDGTGGTNFGYIFGTWSYSTNNDYVPASLKTVVITGGTSIGNTAFYGCTGLTSITIPDSVTSIGKGAFANCSSLESITLPFVGATKDGTEETHFGYIFSAGYHVPASLKTVVITGGTSIGDYAFTGCTGLTSITIPEGVTSIGNYAFNGCTGLTSITIPDSVTRIGYSAFEGCTGLTSITIPSSVTRIGNYAFRDCAGLTSITIPKGVTSIDNSAFYGCTGLESITVQEGNVNYISIGNCLIEKETKTLIAGCKNSEIPADGSVKSIGDHAFYRCTGLTSLTIPSSVTRIGDNAFLNCTGLTSITIPGSVTSIGRSAFGGCIGLTSVYYTGTAKKWSAISIGSNTPLTNATVYYYSETQPATTGNYWHYVDGVPTKW